MDNHYTIVFGIFVKINHDKSMFRESVFKSVIGYINGGQFDTKVTLPNIDKTGNVRQC